MTITQTVEVTNSRRLHLDFEVPRDVPEGRAQVEVKVIPFPTKEEHSDAPFMERRGFGCMKGKIWMAEDFDAPLEDFKDYM